MKKLTFIFLLALGLTAIVSLTVHRANAATPLWDQYCMSCHGSASAFGPRTVAQINNAISTRSAMASLSTLTPADRQTISNELSGTGTTGIIPITAPTAADVIDSGSMSTIIYTAPAEVTSVKVKYSLDGGATWFAADGAPGVQLDSFDWNVPMLVKNINKKALVRVIGYNAQNVKVATGKSAKFTIEVVSITAPIASENVIGGIPYTVTWTTNATKSPVNSAKVSYTYGSSGIWKPADGIVTAIDSLGGTFTWNVPSPAKAKIVKLKIVLKDASGVTVANAVSNAFIVQ